MANIWRKIKKRITGDRFESIEELRERGVIIGSNCHFYNTQIDKSHGFLVEIGDNVTLTNMTILAHDASSKMYIGYSKVGRVTIGNNVFAGYGSIILPGVNIGDDVIIGAGAIVRDNIPSNSVVTGNPATIICNTDEYISKNRMKLEASETPVFDVPWRQKTEAMKLEMKEQLSDRTGFDI